MSHYQRSSSNTPGPGFLGSTSFSCVYQGLQTLHPELPGNDDATHNRRENFYSYDRDSKIRNGAACLSLLQNMPAYDPLLRKWRLGAKLYMTAPWLVACDSSMRTEVYDLLGTSDEMDEQLLRISARIFANTLRPLDLQRGCTLDQYGDKFTGENLRWEAVRIFFSAVGFA